MINQFLDYEDDFAVWVESGFANSRDETQEYLRHLADPEDYRVSHPNGLWPHQWDALLRVIYSKEVAGRSFWEDGLLLDIVTGGGKTAIIAATMVWLKLAHNVPRFLILCPNLIVRDRLESDFRDGKVFIERGLIPPGSVVSPGDFALTTRGGRTSGTSSNLFGANVVLANIHQFFMNSKTGKQNLWDFLEANKTHFALFNDEAHNTRALEYERTLQALQAHESFAFRMDTTATPERADDRALDSRLIYEFGIPAALRHKVIAQPEVYQPEISKVELTYTDQETGEHRRVEEMDWEETGGVPLSATQWVNDREPMRQQISIAKNRLEEASLRANGRYRPILFVVAINKADARVARDVLSKEFKLRTLLVTEDSPDEAREEAAEIGRRDDYDAVVSVSMLREGWDVPEVGVILLLRKFRSRVYGPQVIGRGLRRVRRPDVGETEKQICAIVDHAKLEHEWLWELLRARVRRDVGVDEKFEDTVAVEPEDLPPEQQIVNRDKLISIPSPVDSDIVMPPKRRREPPKEPARNWSEMLAGFEFEVIEITHVEVTGVIGRELKDQGWEQFKSAPKTNGGVEIDPLSEDELREKLRDWLERTAMEATITVGYAPQLRKHVKRELSNYICGKHLDGEAIAYANADQLRAAVRVINQLEVKLLQRPDIIKGMIDYASN